MTAPLMTTGRIAGGRLLIRRRPQFAAALGRMQDGEVTVTVARKHAARSLPQNAWYWGVIVALLSEHTGFTPDEMHAVLKARFLPKRLAVASGNGEIVGEYVIGGSTAKLNKLEFGEYCEAIRQWAAADLGVLIPDPHEAAAVAA